MSKKLDGAWKTMPATIQRAHIAALLPRIKEAVERRDHYRVNVLTGLLSAMAHGAVIFSPSSP